MLFGGSKINLTEAKVLVLRSVKMQIIPYFALCYHATLYVWLANSRDSA